MTPISPVPRERILQRFSSTTQMNLLSGKGPSARQEFFYFSDDGDLTGLRCNKWKVVFLEQKAHGMA